MLSKEYIEYLKKPELNNYSYGWVTGNIPINRVQEFLVEPFTFTFSNEDENSKAIIMEHEGGIPGHHSMIVRIIDKNQLIVLLNNTGHTCLSEIASKVVDVLI